MNTSEKTENIDIDRLKALLELENSVEQSENTDKKEDQLRAMAWLAMWSIIVFTAAMFIPYIPLDRLAVIEDLLSMFYIAQAGIVATFFGTNAYLIKK